MKNPKVALFDAKPYDIEFFGKANKDFEFDIKYMPVHLTKETAVMAEGYDAVCVFVNDIVSSDVISQLEKNGTKLIALRCAGYNNVDLRTAFGKMHVVRVPAYSPHAVAEHALALMMSLNRKIHKAYSRTRDSNFSLNGLLGFDFFGKTAGIIGTGQIGKLVCGMLNGIGMNVIAYDSFPDQSYASANKITYTDLDTLFRTSDVISLHCPLTPENKHLINETTISKMKKGIMIINTGRGKLIDTRALISGLKDGTIGYAGLDVYEEETDYFFEDFSGSFIEDDTLARLLTFPNVLITSHQAFFTNEALINIAATTLGSIKSFFENGRLDHEICYKCSTTQCQKKESGKCF